MTLFEKILEYFGLFLYMNALMGLIRVHHHLKRFELVLFFCGIAIAVVTLLSSLSADEPLPVMVLLCLLFLSYCYFYLGTNLKSQFFNPQNEWENSFKETIRKATSFIEPNQEDLPDVFVGIKELLQFPVGKKLHITKKLLFERKLTKSGHILFMIVMLSGATTRFFIHDLDELHICDEGILIICIKNDDGEITRIHLKENEEYWVKAGTKHSLQTKEFTVVRSYFKV